jgi:putative acetyltransferase
VIRPMEKEDLDEILQIWLSANCEAHPFVPEHYWRENLSAVRQALPGAQVLLWEEDGCILGFIGLQGEYIAGLFVRGGSRGRGVGKALLCAAKEGRRELSLSVYEKNSGALRFYLREGFVPQETGTDSGSKERELLMRWKR